MKINGLDPWDYAALWGSETADGALFYNASSENQPKDRAFLGALIGAIDRQIAEVEADPAKFEPGNPGELRKLRAWTEAQYVAAG